MWGLKLTHRADLAALKLAVNHIPGDEYFSYPLVLGAGYVLRAGPQSKGQTLV